MKLPVLRKATPFRFVGIDLALGKTGIIVLECSTLTDTAPVVREIPVNTDKMKLGDFERWDGLLRWFVAFLRQDKSHLTDRYIRTWHRAASQLQTD